MLAGSRLSPADNATPTLIGTVGGIALAVASLASPVRSAPAHNAFLDLLPLPADLPSSTACLVLVHLAYH